MTPAWFQRSTRTPDHASVSATGSSPERRKLIQAIVLDAFDTGQWDQLAPAAKESLLRRWTHNLQDRSDDDLRRVLQGPNGGFRVRIDPELNLHLVDCPLEPVPTALEAEIERINRVEKRIVHGWDSEHRTLVTTPMESFLRHMTVPGLTGTGKSTYLANLFPQLARAGGPMVLMDCHGTLIESILPHLPPERRGDVVTIDPSDALATWGMNLVQLGKAEVDPSDPNYLPLAGRMLEDTAQNTLYALDVFQEDAYGTSQGPSIRSMLTMGFLAIGERDDTTLTDLCELLADPAILENLQIARPYVASYFRHVFPELRSEYKERARNKVDSFRHTALVNTFSRRDGCQSLAQLVAENKIIVIDLDRTKLPPNISNLLGYLFLTVLQFVVDKRVITSATRMFYAMVDEFGYYASTTTSRWLSEGRKKLAGLIVACQQLAQIPNLGVRVALNNSGTLAVFRTGDEDAKTVASLMGQMHPGTGAARVEQFTQLGNHELKLCYDEPRSGDDPQGPQRRLAVTVYPLPPPPRHPRANELIAEMRARSRAKYAKPNDAKDQETVLGPGAGDPRQLLESLLALSLALRRREPYYLPIDGAQPGGAEAAEALQARRLTPALLWAHARASDPSYSRERFDREYRSLLAHQWAKVVPEPAGPRIELSRHGVAQADQIINPRQSPLEGGPRHQSTLAHLYKALHLLGPVRIVVPRQGDHDKGDYVPDLVVELEGSANAAWMSRLGPARAIHFHVEEGTQRTHAKLYENAVRAADRDCHPILVCYAASRGNETVDRVRLLCEGLRRHQQKGSNLARGETAHMNANPDRPFRWWVVTDDWELFEYDETVPGFTSVRKRYVEETTGPRPGAQSQDATAATAPRRKVEESAAALEAFRALIAATAMNRPTGPLPAALVRECVDANALFAGMAEEQLDDWMQRVAFRHRIETPQGPAFG